MQYGKPPAGWRLAERKLGGLSNSLRYANSAARTDATDISCSSRAEIPPIVALRNRLGLTQEEFGARIGLQTKGSVSLVERGLKAVSADVALAIEELSAGTIDASALNPIVAKARGVEWVAVHGAADSGAAAGVSPGKFGADFPLDQAEAAE